MAFRAFVGVPLQAEPTIQGILESLATSRADLKVVQPANLHATLSFLGDVPDDARGPLAGALDRAVEGVAAFDARLSGIGAFPHARRPRIVWMGIEDPRPLVALATRVRASLAQAGYAGDDKEFRAHITLARTRSERNLAELVAWLRDHAHDPLPEFHVTDARLYRSVLGPAGPTYETLHAASLAPAGA